MEYSGIYEQSNFQIKTDEKNNILSFRFDWADGSIWTDSEGNLWIDYISFKEPRRLKREECSELLLVDFPKIAKEKGVPEDVRESVFTFLHERVIFGTKYKDNNCHG